MRVCGDRQLSRLGLGAWAFGRAGWGAQDDRDSRAAILRAVELGVTWIDTAAVYGDGHSEELVGRVTRELPESDRPLVFTKCGIRVDPATGATFRDLSPRSLREECEASLRRLRTESIDLYQLHWPVQDAGIVTQAWLTLAELQREGKVRCIGVSNFESPLMDLCNSRQPIESVQMPLSLLSRELCRDRLPWAAEREVTALAYSPLESGLLSGSFGPERLAFLPEGDRRRERDQFRGPRLDRTLSLLERLKPIATRLEATLTEVAIAWTLAWPGVSGAIVGARGAAQVDGWINAAKLVLDDSTLTEIAAALTESAAGDGPVSPHPDTWCTSASRPR